MGRVLRDFKVGDTVMTNCGVPVEIKGTIVGKGEYIVEFQDETKHQRIVAITALLRGEIKNPNLNYDIRRKYNQGDILLSRSCGYFKVLEIQTGKVLIKFVDTDYEMWANSNQLSSLSLNDPLARNVAGVGYMGIGPHKSRFPGVGTGKENPAHMTWTGIMGRCYIEDEIMYPRYGRKGARVGDKWHCFQDFATWYELNIPVGSGLQIDKDILFKGNMLYSEETCVAVPSYINNIFKKTPPGKSLMGTFKDSKGLGYKATLKVDSKPTNLGYFRCQLEAHQAWQTAKIRFIYDTIDKYEVESYYDTRVKEALLDLISEIQLDIEEGRPTLAFTA